MPSPTLTLLTVTPQQAGWDATVATNFSRLFTWLTAQPLFVYNHVTSGVPSAGSFNNCLMFITDVTDGLPLYWSNGTSWLRVVPLATTSALGVVKESASVASVGTLATVESASSSYTTTEQSMLNHLKTDVTTLKTQLNALLANMRTAGQLAP